MKFLEKGPTCDHLAMISSITVTNSKYQSWIDGYSCMLRQNNLVYFLLLTLKCEMHLICKEKKISKVFVQSLQIHGDTSSSPLCVHVCIFPQCNGMGSQQTRAVQRKTQQKQQRAEQPPLCLSWEALSILIQFYILNPQRLHQWKKKEKRKKKPNKKEKKKKRKNSPSCHTLFFLFFFFFHESLWGMQWKDRTRTPHLSKGKKKRKNRKKSSGKLISLSWSTHYL